MIHEILKSALSGPGPGASLPRLSGGDSRTPHWAHLVASNSRFCNEIHAELRSGPEIGRRTGFQLPLPVDKKWIGGSEDPAKS